jgi:L-ascorbate metabolism protein UlaG (beta-lactamase superfamily)
MIDTIRWLGHGSFNLQGPPIIFINPWRVVRRVFHPDLILIGHDHYEHCSPADVAKLRGPDTLILTNEKVAEDIEGCTVLRPWQSLIVGKARITGIPAYSPDDMRHPPSAGGLGFVISLNLFDIYYAGDTGKIPEMGLIKPDIAILPIDNNGTLTIEEAAEVVKEMRPRWVIPGNVGSAVDGASMVDVQAFKKAVGHYAEVILPEQTR